MGIFLITPINEPEKLTELVQAKFAGNCYNIPKSNSWIVHHSGTTKELSDLLGLTTGDAGMTGVIVAVSNYYGRAPTDLWEWIKTRMEQK